MKIETQRPKSTSSARGILAGGLLAGLFDITYAIVWLSFRGRSPLWTLQSVASGLLGNSAFEGGVASGLLGLITHFTIATGAAITYWAATRKLEPLRRHPVPAGLAFGVLVYLFMNFVVLPVSAFPFELHYPIVTLARGFLSHALLVGLPIALCLRRLAGVAPAAAGSTLLASDR